jgi:hypothetical protein
MASAANPDAYRNPAWGNQTSGQQGSGSQPPPASGWGSAQGGSPGWGNQPGYGPAWGGPPFWHHAGMSRPLGIVAMILGFILWWPIGLALLFYMIWSGRMGCWARRNRAAYQAGNWQDGSQGGNWGGNWGAGPFGMFRGWCAPQQQAAPTSGNRAFDEYRAETLRRLEEEQKEFGSFLDRLRFAKDKAEFDQFMAERRQRPPQPPTQPEGSQPQA